MRAKRFALTAAMIILMVFAVSGMAENSYAYWASNITPPSDASATGTATTGTWNFIEQWSSTETYVIGDQVINNGSIYEAKKDNPNKEPGVDGGWNSQWNLIGPA